MNDEELRKFCIEQAIAIFMHKNQDKGLLSGSKSQSIFDISNAFFSYIKSGEETEFPFFFRKDVIS